MKKDSKYNGLFTTSEEAKENMNDETLVIVVDVHNKSYIEDLGLELKFNSTKKVDLWEISPLG